MELERWRKGDKVLLKQRIFIKQDKAVVFKNAVFRKVLSKTPYFTVTED